LANRRDSPDARAWVERPKNRIYQRWSEKWDHCARYGVVTVLIACGDLINSLAKHLMSVVFDEERIAPIVKQTAKLLGERQLLVKLAQEQHS
jgi:hypothetical protein